MIKTWQVFVFSLIPLALVFAGVIIGSMPGVDSELEEIPTPPPQAEQPMPPAPGATVLQLVAENIQFDPRALSAAAGQPVAVQMDNRDASVPHNFALYTDQTLSQTIFQGETVTGPTTINYSFEAPAPGTYFFQCDVHPDTMTGSFTTN